MKRSEDKLLYIDFESEDFPASRALNGKGKLRFTWNDLLWAAITIGRPNIHCVFQNGQSSLYEALFRWSMVRMAFRQEGPRGGRLFVSEPDLKVVE